MSVPKNIAYYMDVIEHDSWSGAKNDGLVLFPSKEDAEAFVKKQYADRVGAKSTPEYYVNYENGGYLPVGDKTFSELTSTKPFWASNQGELLK